MLKTTLGQLLINEALPRDLRDYNRVLNKKNMIALATELAQKYPDQYREVTRRLQDVGRETSYTTNGLSVGLDAIKPTISALKKQQEVRQRLRGILADLGLDDKARNMKILELTSGAQKELVDSVYKDAEEQDNPLFHQVAGGIKGNKFQLNSLLGADLQYVDHKNEPIPIPVMRSYSQGLRPVEYFAGAFGTRKGLIDLKTSTSDAGFFAKQLAQINHRLLVTADDDDNTDDTRGFPTDVDDADNEGALLARGVGPYKRNTTLTPKILKDLKNLGIKDILVRSPIVGGPEDGGVYAKDVGYREKNRLPPIGDYVGVAAAQALSEPLTQSMISSKHCLAAGTLVRMADWSVKRIEDIEPGDEVLGADRFANTFPTSVVRTYDNGPRDCIKTRFTLPYSRKDAAIELISTADHKVLMFRRVSNALEEVNNWTPQILPVGTQTGKLSAIMPRGFTGRATLKVEPFALLAGLLLGDGCYTRYKRLKPEPVGTLATYDIEVNNSDHLFVLANGLIVSNSGGVGGAGAIGGFKAINALVQVPEKYPNGATHSSIDGAVQEIRPAPQGGSYVTVGGVDHYVPTGVNITVKKGDNLEAGDVVSDGVPSPAEIVRHKGIGEGRKYFVGTMRQIMQNSGINPHRRNVELLARGMINHVRLTDEHGDYVPDDIVPYSMLERHWQPRTGSVHGAPKSLQGHYLEKPALHYTIGTKIGKSVVDNLSKYGITDIEAHKEPPPFEPEMVRGMASMSTDPDWMTRMLGSYQQKSLLQATHRGGTSDTAGSSFVPGLARGETFGLGGATSGWKS